ncbi:uncharacterized protein ACA1_033530 [Acanthamoeba castellanii str. Neff]|uniref:Uncharacterized protein n=1 Tax=Acanthamoeba castellanii (strain ATCC 30010 / Neff) TaxID=1257118 RepID=L8GGK5_ACACF|nr:uncharacterized protein ACA1_033530 [Acanthamoeba castellanii str. Neff]ELR12205.1 hypothetical protein ACA1_033530 [Acanthamoeba castellanii str. Neff]
MLLTVSPNWYRFYNNLISESFHMMVRSDRVISTLDILKPGGDKYFKSHKGWSPNTYKGKGFLCIHSVTQPSIFDWLDHNNNTIPPEVKAGLASSTPSVVGHHGVLREQQVHYNKDIIQAVINTSFYTPIHNQKVTQGSSKTKEANTSPLKTQGCTLS